MPEDLTPEEQQELENIRRRKQELLEDIQVTLVLNLVRYFSVCKYGNVYALKKKLIKPLTSNPFTLIFTLKQ